MLAAVPAANGDGVRGSYVTVQETDSLRDVVAKMRADSASIALVTSQDGRSVPRDVHVITRKDILDTFADDMELFA